MAAFSRASFGEGQVVSVVYSRLLTRTMQLCRPVTVVWDS